MRKIIQIVSAIVCNANFSGFINGKIYRGPLKAACVPGLNCYSCPGAIGSCPLGSLQMGFGELQRGFPFYVIGILMFFGALFGRLVCGFLCPFGLIQELLHKIPFLKIKPRSKNLRYIKYVFLAVFVIIIPVFYVITAGYAEPAFCKYICPAGTLEAGIPLTLLDSKLMALTGFLYYFKIVVLILIVLLSLMILRPFCRFLCPLGAIYGLFNKISLFRYKVQKGSCTSCGTCTKACKMGIDAQNDVNSMECIRCGSCKKACPAGAIQWQNQLKGPSHANETT